MLGRSSLRSSFLARKKWISGFIKRNRIVIVVVASFLCFKSLIEDGTSIYLIPVLRRFECSYASDAVFLLACAWIAVWACKCVRKGCKLEDRYPILAWSVLLLWVWYRFFDADAFVLYKLYSAYGDLPICYVDGIAVGCAAILVVWCFHKQKTVQYKVKGFLLDKPIANLEDDVLYRGENARDAVHKLLETNTEECAFTFGIVGQWGDGKTSFMNMMKRSIKIDCGDDVIVMDYSPWLYGEIGNITREFFKVLRSQLSEYGPAISSDIAAYSDALTAIDSPWSKYLNTLVALMTKPQTAEAQYKRLKKTLKSIGKRIVVFVDDIDRLGAKEMSEVFRLVRNTSNLPHMYFVLAYDKEYVVNTLQQEFGRKSISFTDKIMQEEYPLPKIQAGMLRRSLIQTFRNFASADDIQELEEVLNSDSFFRNDFFELANTLRDIKRLGNRLRDHYERMRDDVWMRDYLLMSLMLQKFPKVYAFISAKRDEIFVDGYDNKIYLYNKEEKKAEDDKKSEFIISKKRLVIPVDLLNYIDEDRTDNTLQIQEHQRELLKRLLEALWAKWRNVSAKGVNNRLYCSRYFYNNVLEQEMTEKEFEDFWNLEFDAMKDMLPSLIQNKLYFLIRKLGTINPSSREELRKLLRIMFFVNNAWAGYSFDHDTITTRIGDLRAFNPGYQNYIKSDIDFVRDLLLENKDCLGTVVYLDNLQGHNPELKDFPLSVVELNSIKRTLFLNFVPLHRNDFNSLSYMFMHTVRKEDKIKEKSVRYEKCVEILKRCVMNNFEDFMPFSLISHQSDTGHMYSLNSYPSLLWGSNEEYFRYVERMEDTSDAMNEYKRFCNLMRRKKNNEPIKFFFKALKVNDD